MRCSRRWKTRNSLDVHFIGLKTLQPAAIAAKTAGWQSTFRGAALLRLSYCSSQITLPTGESLTINWHEGSRFASTDRRNRWPALRHYISNEENAAHMWHTQPLLRIGFMVGSGNGRLTGVQYAGDPQPCDREPSKRGPGQAVRQIYPVANWAHDLCHPVHFGEAVRDCRTGQACDRGAGDALAFEASSSGPACLRRPQSVLPIRAVPPCLFQCDGLFVREHEDEALIFTLSDRNYLKCLRNLKAVWHHDIHIEKGFIRIGRLLLLRIHEGQKDYSPTKVRGHGRFPFRLAGQPNELLKCGFRHCKRKVAI